MSSTPSAEKSKPGAALSDAAAGRGGGGVIGGEQLLRPGARRAIVLQLVIRRITVRRLGSARLSPSTALDHPGPPRCTVVEIAIAVGPAARYEMLCMCGRIDVRMVFRRP